MATTNHFESASTWQDLMQIANTNTGGWFWLAMSFLIWIIILLGFLPFGFETAILTSSFAGFIITLFLAYADLISWGWCFSFIAMIIFMLFYITYNKRSY